MFIMRKCLVIIIVNMAIATALCAQESVTQQSNLLNLLKENVEFSGLVEIEGAAASDFDNRDTSDVKVATVELGFDTQLDDYVSGHVLLLFEEDDTEPMEVDEATITLGGTDSMPLFLTAGRMYLPFGVYDSSAISDPFTLELAETRQSLVQIGAKQDGWYASAYAFNCDSEKANDSNDDQIECFGGNLGYNSDEFGAGYLLEAGYLNNLADTDLLEGYLHDSTLQTTNRTGAYALSASATLERLKLIGELVSATGDLDLLGTSLDAPLAWNLEADYNFNLMGKDSVFVLGYHASDNLVGLLPESRILGSLGVGLTKHLTTALEYAHDIDYSENEGGSNGTADTVTM